MKMSYETKEKMANQRLRRMKAYFNAYGVGSKIYLMAENGVRELDWAYVLAYHEYNSEFYYVLGKSDGAIFIGKVVYSGCAGVIRVPKTNQKYLQNKSVFDAWIKTVKLTRERDIIAYYNAHGKNYGKNKGEFVYANEYVSMVGQNGKRDAVKFVLKEQLKDKYYFVLHPAGSDYVVAKVVWRDGFIQTVMLSDAEFEANKEEFAVWILEAKKKEAKGNIYG